MKKFLLFAGLLTGYIVAIANTNPVNAAQFSNKLEQFSPELHQVSEGTSLSQKHRSSTQRDIQYGEWEFVDSASWDNASWSVFHNAFETIGDNHFAVEKRVSVNDPNTIQIKLVKVFNGYDFILDYNLATYSVSANRQPSGLSCSWQNEATLDNFEIEVPERYYYGTRSNASLAGGVIYLDAFLFYYIADDNNKALVKESVIITFDKASSYDYTVETKHIYLKNDKQAQITLKPQGDVKQFKYVILKDRYAPINLSQIFSENELKTAENNTITFNLEAGTYKVLLLPCDADGTWLGCEINDRYIWFYRTCTILSNADDGYEWVDYGTGRLKDICAYEDYYNYYPADKESLINKTECKLLTRKDAYGKIIRVVNPYGNENSVTKTLLENEGYSYIDSEDFYIDINAEDPEHVYLYYRPLGLNYNSENVGKFSCYNTPLTPISCSYAYAYLLEGNDDYFKTSSGKVYWNRIAIKDTNPSLILEINPSIELIENQIDNAGNLYINVDENIAYIRYAFSEPSESGMDIADKIAADDSSIEIYTAYAPDNSRANENIISIKVPKSVKEQSYIVALAYTGDNTIKSVIDEQINVWHNIGKAQLASDQLLYYGFKEQADVEQCNAENLFRLVNPAVDKANNPGTYFYINATDPENVNFSGDGTFKNYDTGLYMGVEGYSTDITNQINSIYNLITELHFIGSGSPYSFGKMNKNIISTDDQTIGMTFYSADNAGYFAYLSALTITLPESVSAGIDDIITDGENDFGDVNAPIEYYNMQGIKVSNPTNGIFIKRQGSKTEKILKH